MTDAQILTTFEGLIDDTLDQELELSIANTAKNRLERELKMLIHQKSRESQSTSVGQTYATAISLPADFRTWVSLYRGTDRLRPVPFAKRAVHRTDLNRFYTNHKDGTYHLTGTQAVAQTLIETYIYKTDDISSATVTAGSTTLTWHSDFHMLLPYEMAKVFYAIDAGDKARAWDDRWDAHYNMLRKALIDWDHDLKLQEMDGSLMPDDDNESEDRINP